MVEEKNETEKVDDTTLSDKDINDIDQEIGKTETKTKEELKKELQDDVKEQVDIKMEELTTQQKIQKMEEDNKKLQEQLDSSAEAMKQLQEKVDETKPQRKGLVDNEGNPLKEQTTTKREPTNDDIGNLVDNSSDPHLALKKTLGL